MSNKLQVSTNMDSKLDHIEKLVIGVVNGQSAMKGELLMEIHKVDKKLEDFREETKKNFEKVNERIDKIGMQEANLEDDAPTIEEFDELKVRVTKVEEKVALCV